MRLSWLPIFLPKLRLTPEIIEFMASGELWHSSVSSTSFKQETVFNEKVGFRILVSVFLSS